MKNKQKFDRGFASFSKEDFVKDLKEICGSDIPEEVLSAVIDNMPDESFMHLIAQKNKPGVYRDFLKQAAFNLPISYAHFKMDETINGLKNLFKLSGTESVEICLKAVEIIKDHNLKEIMINYMEKAANEKTIPDDKAPPFEEIDPNHKGLKIVKNIEEANTIH